MPRILRIQNRFNLGGPTYNTAYLTKYLEPEFETILVGGMKDESEANSEYIVRNLSIEPIIIPDMRRSLNPINDIKSYNKIIELIKYYKPDIVHTHAAKAGALGRIAAYNLKVPVIIHTFHGHVFNSYFGGFKTNVYKLIEKKLANISTKIIAISDLQKHELSEIHKICKPEKIEVIPLGFDLSKFQENMHEKRLNFRKEYLLDDEEIAIGIIGRLVPVKNHALFLQSLKYCLENSNKKIRAFIIGDGEDRKKIEDKAKELNINFTDFTIKKQKSSLTFTSWIKDVDYAMAGIDIIALTSLNEGTPVSLIEAQAANKPIVTTEVGGIKNVVIENKTALLSPNQDYQLFANNLLRMINDENLRKELSLLGWDYVKNKFHYTRLINDTKNLYLKLL